LIHDILSIYKYMVSHASNSSPFPTFLLHTSTNILRRIPEGHGMVQEHPFV
jgi:hypothetical protein